MQIWLSKCSIALIPLTQFTKAKDLFQTNLLEEVFYHSMDYWGTVPAGP
jgi:hypothetical protein